ncbi:NUDIX domain-containing protein [Candidatus Woesearchaeota archaeon]|nr:NUDIX domain-containing protein [Candidatus Woesearchaeota archaeon]
MEHMQHVVGAFIVRENKVLMLFRKEAKHYESVGGKVEPESCKNYEKPTELEFQQNLVREIKEEIGESVTVSSMHLLGEKKYINHKQREYTMRKYIVIIQGQPIINEPAIFEKVEWLPVHKLESYPISSGSKPFVPLLKEMIKLNGNRL